MIITLLKLNILILQFFDATNVIETSSIKGSRRIKSLEVQTFPQIKDSKMGFHLKGFDPFQGLIEIELRWVYDYKKRHNYHPHSLDQSAL